MTLNFMQTARSQQAADRLRARVAPTATVLRDGQWRELPRRELVPGDFIRLAAGDLIPADAQLVEAHDLHVQQAALTGESLPVEAAMAYVAEQTTIFARLSPAQKNRIILALKNCGHVVGLPLRWHQRRAFPAHCRCRYFRLHRGGCCQRCRRDHSAGTQLAGAASGSP
jgi:magnesium-transporting ATPase (P-type)